MLHAMLSSSPIVILAVLLVLNLAIIGEIVTISSAQAVLKVITILFLVTYLLAFGSGYLEFAKVKEESLPHVKWHHFVGKVCLFASLLVGALYYTVLPVLKTKPLQILLLGVLSILFAGLVYVGWLGGQLVFVHRVGVHN